jgi:peptidoglycan/LPS O-acetylase OafA/YrhL
MEMVERRLERGIEQFRRYHHAAHNGSAESSLRTRDYRLGDSSTALYLIHPILAPALCSLMSKLHVTSLPLILIATIAIVAGHVVFLFVETLLNRWARRLWNANPPCSQPA